MLELLSESKEFELIRCPKCGTVVGGIRLQSPIIRIHGSQRDISSVADHERSDGDEILLSST